MSLHSSQLDAFVSIVRTLNFSKAVDLLHVTQSALSQRIKNLEGELGHTLFIRDRAGVRLTEFGERLFRYCQVKSTLEADLLSDLKSTTKGELTGILRIGSYSSVLRSVVIPALSRVLREHPKIQCEFVCKKMGDLPGMLQRSEVDFIIMDYKWERSGVETHLLGYEEFVVIESSEFKNRNDIFLDNDPQDRVTSDFFRKQKHKISYRRSYMDDAYGILDGAAQGLGRAVMSRHLVSNTAGIRIVPGFSPWKLNVVLHYYSQPFYPKLQGAVVSELVSKCPKWLGDK